MPIEFRCPACTKLLRTPDDSAGRKARCPECGDIVNVPSPESSDGDEVPLASPSAKGVSLSKGESVAGVSLSKGESEGISFDKPADAGAASTQPSNPNPFADWAPSGPAPSKTESASQANNPYASAASPFAGEASSPFRGASYGSIRHSKVDFSEIFSTTWQAYTDGLGVLVLAMLTILGIMLVPAALLGVGAAILGAAAGGGPPDGAIMAVMGIGALLFFPLMILLGLWIQAGMVKLTTAIARGAESNLSLLFEGGGRVMLNLFLYGLIYSVLYFVLYLACVAPGAALGNETVLVLGGLAIHLLNLFLMLFLALSPYFIVDRNAGPIDAMSQSVRFMSGNKLMVFLVYLVGGLLTVPLYFAAIITCGLGIFVIIPFYLLLPAVVYLQATGQETISSRLKRYR